MKPIFSVAVLLLGAAMSVPSEAASVIEPDEWQLYVDSFVDDSGRVIDGANGNISHSEGQGYGLLLAVLAEDRATFERIWSFTQTELLLRNDGLAAWRWEPQASPNVTDTNNATDGDILIAYALELASELWDEPAYGERAREMVQTMGRTMLIEADGMPAILPGEQGFSGNEDDPTPVLNLSYWVFEALPVFARMDPDANWQGVYDTGLELARRAAVTPTGIPSDWVQMKEGTIVPAPDFDAEFGYNNIRVPVYLMRAGINPDYLGPYRRNADESGLYKINVVSGARIEPISEPGYRLIRAAMECVAAGTPVPEDLRSLSATSYYAATLQLLLLDYLRREQTRCLGGAA